MLLATVFSTLSGALKEKKKKRKGINNLGPESETFASREMGFLIFYFYS